MSTEAQSEARASVRQFAVANGVLVTVLASLLTIESLREYLHTHLIYAAIAVACFEALLWFAIRQLNYSEIHTVRHLFSEFPIDEIITRFGGSDDFPNMEGVYHEWFPRAISIDDAEFRLALARGFSRVVECVLSSGKRELVGYYTAWPITRNTFELLISGKLKERAITSEMIKSFDDTSGDVLYIPEICRSKVHPDIGEVILKDAVIYLRHLLLSHEHIAAIGAWGYTKIGRELCQRYLMRRCQKPSARLTHFFEVNRSTALLTKCPKTTFEPTRRRKLM